VGGCEGMMTARISNLNKSATADRGAFWSLSLCGIPAPLPLSWVVRLRAAWRAKTVGPAEIS
jgi:hypothetical protein